MKFKINLSLALFLNLTVILLVGCQPSSHLHTTAEDATSAQVTEEEDLKPTVDPNDISNQQTQNGVKYQPLPKKIKNTTSDVDLILDRVTLEKAKMTYNRKNRKIKVTGLVHLFDENKKEIATTDFSLFGQHDADDNIFFLKGDRNEVANSLQKPVVRAKATCLNVDRNGNFDCSNVVIDFFIAYDKEIFTEQLTVNRKTRTPQQPKQNPNPPKNQPGKNNPPPAASQGKDELQPEGSDDSINGRFEGHAETADLKQIFADDQAQPKKEEPKKEEPKKEEPKKEEPKKEEPKKEEPVTNDIKKTDQGLLRPTNQAIGLPDNGKVRNSTSVFTKQQILDKAAFFEVVHPDRNRHFGTYEMTELITRMGQKMNDSYSRKVYVGNVSQKFGGFLPPHLSHQAGIDADFGYPSSDNKTKFPLVEQMSPRKFYPANFSVQKTYELLKFAFTQPDIKVARFFIDRTIKQALCDYAKNQGEFQSKDKEIVQDLFESIQHVDGHGDHFHIRLRCSKYDPACQNRNYAVNQGC